MNWCTNAHSANPPLGIQGPAKGRAKIFGWFIQRNHGWSTIYAELQRHRVTQGNTLHFNQKLPLRKASIKGEWEIWKRERERDLKKHVESWKTVSENSPTCMLLKCNPKEPHSPIYHLFLFRPLPQNLHTVHYQNTWWWKMPPSHCSLIVMPIGLSR